VRKTKFPFADQNLVAQEIRKLEAVADPGELSTFQMVEQFVSRAQSIRWTAIGSASRELLSSIEDTLSLIADLTVVPELVLSSRVFDAADLEPGGDPGDLAPGRKEVLQSHRRHGSHRS
jgi:hypothetical protein